MSQSKMLLLPDWDPRSYQAPLLEYLQEGGTRADVVAHRRWGKDEVALNWAEGAAVHRPGVYWHLLPEAAQGRKASETRSTRTPASGASMKRFRAICAFGGIRRR